MPTWFNDSFLILHYDRHYSSSDPQPGSGLDPEQVRRLLERVRPDVVQIFAKGYPGYVPFPTRLGNQLHDLMPAVAGHDAPDILAVYRDAARELGIRFVIAYSGLIDHQAADWRPGWLRIRSDYSPYPNRAICVNSGYVEDTLLSQLDELLTSYQPDGIWMDAENWTVAPCYCATCESEYQMLHERSAPRDHTDPMWPQWIQFQRDAFRRYMSRVALYLHQRGTEVVYASSGAFSTHQAEALEEVPDRLSRELSPAYSLRQAGLEARFFDRKGIPFDLMTWNRCSARPWSQGRLAAIPAQPKSVDHLCQEGAVILANGGRWSLWVSVYPDDSLPERQHEVAAKAAGWARWRQPWCTGTASAAYVAVLHSDTTHRAAGNGLYDPGPSLDRVRGAHQALLELHYPHDIVNEDTLYREINRYDVVVLPEQIALSPDLDALLEEWVQHGGKLIASGRVSPRILEDIPTFALENVLGIRWTGGQDAEGILYFDEEPIAVAAPTYHVALHGAETLVPLAGSTNENRPQVTDWPAVTRYAAGRGEGYYLACDFFSAYHRSQFPGLRRILGQVLERAVPEPALLTTAPPSVEVVARERDQSLLVHFVNHDPGKSLAQNSAFVERVPKTEPFSVTLAVGAEPARVRLQPEDVEPEWSFSEGTLTVFIPPFHIHTAVVVEAAPATEPVAAEEDAAAPETANAQESAPPAEGVETLTGATEPAAPSPDSDRTAEPVPPAPSAPTAEPAAALEPAPVPTPANQPIEPAGTTQTHILDAAP